MATRRRFAQQRGARRQTSWENGPFGRNAITTETSTLVPTGIAATLPGLTLIRVRGEMYLALTTAAAAFDGFGRIACGLAIVSENAFTVGGAGSVPDPLIDVGWEGWLWHWMGSLATNTAFTLPSNNGPSSVRVVIDSKSMRKWKETDVLCGVVSTDDEISSTTLRTSLNTRVLVKLP